MDLCCQSNVFYFNMLSRLVITFLPRYKHLLISWLQSPSAVILEPKKVKSVTVSIVSPSICHEVMRPEAMIVVSWMLSFKPTFSLSIFRQWGWTSHWLWASLRYEEATLVGKRPFAIEKGAMRNLTTKIPNDWEREGGQLTNTVHYTSQTTTRHFVNKASHPGPTSSLRTCVSSPPNTLSFLILYQPDWSWTMPSS